MIYGGGGRQRCQHVKGRRQRFTPSESAGRPRPNITPSHWARPKVAESEGNRQEAEGNERQEQEDVQQSSSVNQPQGSRVGPSLTGWNHVSDLVGAPGTFVFMLRGTRRGAHALPTRSDDKTRDVKLPSVESSSASSGTVSDTAGWLSPENPSHVSTAHSDWLFGLVESERLNKAIQLISQLSAVFRMV